MDANRIPLEVYAEYEGNGVMPVDCLDDFEEAYAGEWSTELEFTENLVDELGILDELPENLRFYFDFEAFSRDLFIDDYFSAPNPCGPGIFVFRNI